MIRRPPRSTLFPTRRSSDLLPGDDALRRFLHLRFRHVSPESAGDRKSTRLNSSHTVISYAVFCLKKKNEDVLGLAKTPSRIDEIGRPMRRNHNLALATRASA